MDRTAIAATMLLVAVLGSLTSCSSRAEPEAASVSSAETSGPSSTWLAVLASSADPNDLDVARSDVVAALDVDDGPHVLVSPGACFTGIPSRYGPLYVLALADATRALVQDRLRVVGSEPEWMGTVTSTCID
jgi:hypothetical protein